MKAKEGKETSCLMDLLDYLQFGVLGFPYSHEHDSWFFGMLDEEFHEFDLLEQMKEYYPWAIDNLGSAKKNFRFCFRMWLEAARTRQEDALQKTELHYEF